MSTALFLILAAAAAAADPAVVQRSTTTPILIVHPAERQLLGGGEGEWVLGSVSDPKATLTINGSTVPVHRTGAFLAWLAVQPGTFTFSALLTLPNGTTAALERFVTVAEPPQVFDGKKVEFDESYTAPRSDVELRPGDWLVARARATRGKKARFRLHGRPWQPMREVNPALGVYEGAFVVSAQDQSSKPRPVEIEVGSKLVTTPGKVAVVTGTPPIVQVRSGQPVNVKTGPGEGEFFPVLPGARMITAGRVGSETKLVFGGGQTGAIDTRHLEPLPEGSAPPRAETDAVTVRPGSDSTSVRIGVSERVPFIVDESDDLRTLTVRLHYTYAHTNWIVYGAADALVEEVRLRQEAHDVVAVTIRLRPGRRVWGWQVAYDGSGVRVDLRKPPIIGVKALAGRAVFLDPGHMPSAPGTMGGLGTREMDVNYLLAKAVEALLIKEGARPIMSRAGPDDEVGLQDRPRLAAEKRADVFVSIHNNNIPSGRHPFRGSQHGFSVFYYHPHSLELARAVYDAYKRHVPLPGEELRYGNLLVARMAAMPSILTETAYLTYPEQEEMLLDPGFRRKVATAIVEGLRAFFELERERQKRRRDGA